MVTLDVMLEETVWIRFPCVAEAQVTLCTVPCGRFSQAAHCVVVSAPAYASFSRVVGETQTSGSSGDCTCRRMTTVLSWVVATNQFFSQLHSEVLQCSYFSFCRAKLEGWTRSLLQRQRDTKNVYITLTGLQPDLIIPSQLISSVNTSHETIVDAYRLWTRYVHACSILLPTTNILFSISLLRRIKAWDMSFLH